MNTFTTLIRREWMQHRFGWALTATVPLLLAVLLLSFGNVQVQMDAEMGDSGMPPVVAVAALSVVASMAVMLLLATVTSLVTVVGLARRDHADRSVEFWLSLPIGHSRSLAVPMGVHLVLVPLLALLWGALAGVLVSAVLVSRTYGFGAWLDLPWSDAAKLIGVLLTRSALGWPLALLWLAPLILLAMLMFAWMRRWGLVVFGLLLAIGNSPLGAIAGYHWLPNWLSAMAQGAAGSLYSGGDLHINAEGAGAAMELAGKAPAWLISDFASSLTALASPVLLGGLVFAAACFFGLVQWRKRGASVAV